MSRSTNSGAVVAAVMLATFLAALDTTVVGTAMPTIIGEMGGLELYSWVFSAYLLTSTTAVPLFGRLADMYGRKPVFFVGAGIFVAGSMLCALAGNMEQLILFRAIQGVGAASVVPVSLTVVGDMFSIAERARIQGLLSAVWGISAILGPGLGGMIADNLNWRWVFYVNVPFGLVSVLLFAVYLHERPSTKPRSIDYAGTAALTLGITLLLVGLLQGGNSGGEAGLPWWVLIAAATTLIAIFLWHQSNTAEPLLPMLLFRNRVFSVSNGAGFLAGAALMGVSSYVPPFVQGVLGGTAVNAGAALAPMSIGWPIASTLSGRFIIRHGYRPVVLVGSSLIFAGVAMLIPLQIGASQLWVMAAMFVMGLGLGLAMTSFLVAVQSSVGWGERGIATASVSFFRSIGGAVGVAALGGLMNGGMNRGLAEVDAGLFGGVEAGTRTSAASSVLDPVARGSMDSQLLEAIRRVMASSLVDVYWALAAVTLGGVALAMLFPKGGAKEKGREQGGQDGIARSHSANRRN